MEYINHVLGINVRYQGNITAGMPNFIASRYRIQRVSLDGKTVAFVYPKDELEPVSTLKKHMARISKEEGIPSVLVPAHLTSRQREYMLRDHIPFVVEGKQIYLPFMAVYLQERGDAEKNLVEKMLPSAQLLLLYYIYCGCSEITTSECAQYLDFTPTSISRATRQLEEFGLIKTEKRGVQKVILSEKTPEEVFKLAKEKMCNPIKRTIYVSKKMISKSLLLSGYSALSEYTMLNPPMVECFATDSIAKIEKAGCSRLQSADDQFEVQLWRYDPRKLTKNGLVDPLSLALVLGDNQDERVEEAVEQMLNSVWEGIHGKRN